MRLIFEPLKEEYWYSLNFDDSKSIGIPQIFMTRTGEMVIYFFLKIPKLLAENASLNMCFSWLKVGSLELTLTI